MPIWFHVSTVSTDTSTPVGGITLQQAYEAGYAKGREDARQIFASKVPGVTQVQRSQLSRSAWLYLIRLMHPDVNQSPYAAEVTRWLLEQKP